jgi:hypothetical protein
MKRMQETNIISNVEHIKRAYIELLKVQGVDRIKINDELCGLRNLISDLVERDDREVQEECEEIALQERIRDKELIEDQWGNTFVFCS